MSIIANDHELAFFKPGLSATSVNHFFSSPAKFWKNSSLNPERVREPGTPAMLFGRAVHHLILTPELFEKDFVVQPEKPAGCLDTISDMKAALTAAGIPFKASANKPEFIMLCKQTLPGATIWDEVMFNFEKNKGARDIIFREEYKKALEMRDAMFANKAVRQLIGNGMSEKPVCWWKEQGGLMWKTKLDYARAGLVIEYKTTDSAQRDELAKSIGNFGYHRQLAIQSEGYEILNGEKPRGAIIIAQEKDILDNIAIYPISQPALATGRTEVDWAERGIKERLKAGDWKTFPESILEPIDLPRYYDYKENAQKAQQAA